MKCISVRQPWANRIASGIKTIETRTWGTKYRGLIAIASSKIPERGHRFVDVEPLGCVIAIVRLVDCRPMTLDDQMGACCKIYPDAYSWVLEDVEKIEPLKVKGQLGIYEIDLDELPLLGE